MSYDEDVCIAGKSGHWIWQFLDQSNIELPYDPAIPFLGVHPEELEIGVQTKACT